MINGYTELNWSSDLVKLRLVEALMWLKRASGPVGPASVRSSMPIYRATLDDHLDEGWGIPEIAGDDEPSAGRKIIIAPSPELVEQFIDRLTWVSRYVHPTNPGSAKMLSLWLRCKVDRATSFEEAAREALIGKSHAYRLRDRGLSIIAVGLIRDGVPV